MDILLKPDSLSLTGSMNHFIISSSQEVTFDKFAHGYSS
nr:MAG TPA: hypothetical protein [Caudoviricetes sp.]